MQSPPPATIRRSSDGAPISALARLLSGFVARPVVDGTGADGDFAVRFTYLADTSPIGRSDGTPLPPGRDQPSVFVAVEEQLGLKLQAATVTVQVVVIDRIERPTEN